MKAGVAILGAVAFLAACGEPNSPEATPVGTAEHGTVVVVEVEEIQVSVPVEGTVVARNRAEITTRMMARITEVAAEVGSRVRVGQVLVRLGTEDIAANRTKAEAAVRVASAARDEAEKQAARMDALLAQDVVPQVQRDQAHLQLTQAESQLAMAAATLAEVETAGSYAAIRAPFDGEVVGRYVDKGDVAAPGLPLLAVEEAGPRDGRLAVPVEVAEGLKIGSFIRVGTSGGRSVEAPVRVVSAGADPMSKTVEVRVTLPADWPTGVSLSALVPAGTTRAVTIPADAVVRRGQLTGVRVVTADGVALRWIRLGRTVGTGDRVEVLSGLAAGDRIVLPGAEAAQ
ncbi:MAG: efflux RND transporter periplasmic adaptor subunit [Longimicrobiales bacterium]|nr:efflux RND transporter periplasmic adaptor subunit [Longimicrobiales bacterium]